MFSHFFGVASADEEAPSNLPSLSHKNIPVSPSFETIRRDNDWMLVFQGQDDSSNSNTYAVPCPELETSYAEKARMTHMHGELERQDFLPGNHIDAVPVSITRRMNTLKNPFLSMNRGLALCATEFDDFEADYVGALKTRTRGRGNVDLARSKAQLSAGRLTKEFRRAPRKQRKKY